ncbi:hypothetical protein Q7C36_021163 [Tachysurus vachellii]|uniref:Centrosomal protein of 70 kDa n=1 Tax=Tachysurus vachellii TaxID=175792 RepID=A0AA88J8U2_TACVA|nr:hypothetical protein Q7C36_021163 [Tachysurus vachellii]
MSAAPAGGFAYKQEQTEWDAVNRLLQHHGFKPVRFADPTENKNLSDLVLLERWSSSELRLVLKTMLMDSERRQALIQELIQSNSKLKTKTLRVETSCVGRLGVVVKHLSLSAVVVGSNLAQSCTMVCSEEVDVGNSVGESKAKKNEVIGFTVFF